MKKILLIISSIIAFAFLVNDEWFWAIIFAIPVFIYFNNKKDKQATIAVNREIKDNIDINNAINKHNKKVSKLGKDYKRIKEEREKFAKEINLLKRLYDFYEEIKYYPSWYKNSKNDDNTPHWRSKTIKPGELSIKKYKESKLKKLLDENDNLKDSDDILEYSFEAGDEKCVLYVCQNRKEHFMPINKDEYYYPAYIFISNKNVFKADLNFIEEFNEITSCEYFTHSWLGAFKPNGWLAEFLTKIDNVKEEKNKYDKEFHEKIRKDEERRAKENFT